MRLDAEADDADEKAAASDTDDQPLQPLRVGAVQCRRCAPRPSHQRLSTLPLDVCMAVAENGIP